MVGVVLAEDLTEAFGLGFDAALAAGPLEGGLELGASQSSSCVGVGASLRTSWASERQRPFFQGSNAARAAG